MTIINASLISSHPQKLTSFLLSEGDRHTVGSLAYFIDGCHSEQILNVFISRTAVQHTLQSRAFIHHPACAGIL